MFFATGFVVRELAETRREAEVAEQNLRAAFDSTMAVFREQVRSSTRLAVQSRIEAEDATEAMREALEERDASLVALQTLEVQFDSLEREAQTPEIDTVFVENGDTVRVATFALEGPPIEGEQIVRVNRDITLDSRLRVSPFSLGYGIACSGSAPVFTWDTPEWVQARFVEGTVDPSVCYQEPSSALFEISTGKSIWLLLGFGAGLALGSR